MIVESTMLPLGTLLPDFVLPEVATGRVVKTSDFVECRALVVVFLSTQCPYAIHVRPELPRLALDYADRGVGFVGICSSDTTQHPEDAPPHLAAMARAAGIKFPILFDSSQAVAKAFAAACTPDFFLFDAGKHLAYRGQLDASRPARGAGRPGLGAPDGMDLRAALDAVLAGWPAAADQRRSSGTGIAWKLGNAPAYSAA
jgi:peroxiredoxin